MTQNTTSPETWQPTTAETASWIMEVGSTPVMIPIGKKGPETKNWNQVKYPSQEVAEAAFSVPCNVGILLGAEYKVVDIDLDCMEAAAVARYLLPQDTSVFGRESSPRSHYLYSCEEAGEAIRMKDGAGKITVELRSQPGGKACQTVMPGSVHPCGEHIVWWKTDTPKAIPFDQLSLLIRDTHAASMLLRHYPGEGSRHDYWLAIGGLFAKCDIPQPRTMAILEAVFQIAEPDEPWEREDRNKAVATSYSRHASGQSCKGWSALIEYVPDPELRSLGLQESSYEPSTPEGQPHVHSDVVSMDRLIHPCQFMKEDVGGLSIRVTRLGAGGRMEEENIMCTHHSDGTRSLVDQDAISVTLQDGKNLYFLVPMNESEGTRQWDYDGALAWVNKKSPPVDVPTLMVEIVDMLEHYIDLPDEYAEGALVTLAYWSLLSYCFTAWHAVPYLSLTGERGCGKSRVLDCLSELVFSPVLASNMSEPSMFRTMHSTCGTLLYDEAEAVTDKDRIELLTMLNAGHQSKFAVARRCEKKARGGFSVADYRIYGPKAFAAIRTLPPALLSRSIIIPMVRASTKSRKIRRRVHTADETFRRIRSCMHSVAIENHGLWNKLALMDMPRGMEFSGRQMDLWQPILSLCNQFTPEHVPTIAEFANISLMIEEERLENPMHKAVLDTLYGMRVEGKTPSAAEILDYLKLYGPSGMFERWTGATVGRTLSNFGIRSCRLRAGGGGGRKRSYDIPTKDLADLALRHGYILAIGEGG